MKTMNAFRFGKLYAAMVLIVYGALGACITVNVNFPETAVQRAADDFVKDLYKADTASAKTNPAADAEEVKSSVKDAPKKTKKKKEPEKATSGAFRFLEELNPFSIPSALAQTTIKLKGSTPKLEALKGKMKGRISELNDWKTKGFVGENFNGMLEIRDKNKLNDADEDKIEDLVDAENDDREDLYEEFKKANNLPGKLEQTGQRFGQSFREASPKGTWVEAEKGKWIKK